jgi:hypothetical protein
LKKAFLLFNTVLCAGLLTQEVFSQGVGINTTGAAADSSAILDASSTTKGFLPPRMTIAERNAISSPAKGLMIYNVDLDCIQYNKGTPANPNWICSDGTNESNPFICGSSTITFTYNGASVTYGTVSRDYSSLAAPHGVQGTKCWLDRNLGANQVAVSSTDHLSYGDLFQWGRSDDGHQLISWTDSITGNAINSSQPGQSSSLLPGNVFFHGTSSNWYAGANPDDLWQGVSGINNPCPNGWRVPTESELNAERASWSNPSADGAFASALKFPVAGRRIYTDGTVDNFGFELYGHIWSSTINGNMSRFIFYHDNCWGNCADTHHYNRRYGLSVRCIKD